MRTYYIFLLYLFFIFPGCTKVEEQIACTFTDTDDECVTTRASVLPSSNPYSLDNIQNAYREVRVAAGQSAASTPTLKATHKYVKFLPQDTIQMHTLRDSLRLTLFPYPLDIELTTEQMDYYRRNKEGLYGWQYTVVPVDFQFPSGIERNELGNLYIQKRTQGGWGTPEPNATEEGPLRIIGGQSNQIPDSQWDNVLKQAMINAGYLTGSTLPQTWTAKAKITYTDDKPLGNTTFPLENVKVIARNFTDIQCEGYTDAAGETPELGEFRYPIYYEVRFEGPEWILKDGEYDAAVINVNKQKGPLNLSITADNERTSAFAAVHLGMNYIFHRQSEIAVPDYRNLYNVAVLWDDYCHTDDYMGVFYGSRNNGNDIKIWGKKGENQEEERYEMTSITLHEVVHASHYSNVMTVYNSYEPYFSDKMLKESYARAGQYYFINQLYPDYPDICPDYFDEYTCIGEGLVVHGMSLHNLEFTVLQSKNMREWQDNVLRLGRIPSEVINLIFLYPLEHWHKSIYEGIECPQDAYYTNVTMPFQILSALSSIGAEITDWEVSPSTYKIKAISDTNSWIHVVFEEAGSYTLSCHVALSPGFQFTAQETFYINAGPEVTGDSAPRMGCPAVYRVSSSFDSSNGSWSVGQYIQGNYVGYTGDKVLVAHNSNASQLSVIFMYPGEYVVRGEMSYEGNHAVIEYPVTVPYEGVSAAPAAVIVGIKKVSAWFDTESAAAEHRVTEYMTTIPSNRAGISLYMGDVHSFRTFSKLPRTDHPYYGNLLPVYHVRSADGRYGYDNISVGTWTPVSTTPAFYVFRAQVPGSVPVYQVRETVQNSGQTVSDYIYLSRSAESYNKTTDNGTETRTIMKQVGYVFPL